MFKLLLQGVYNHGEVFWLETSWALRRLFGSYIYTQTLKADPAWIALDGWVEIMPSAHMLRFCDYSGSTTYKYRMLGLYIFQYRDGFYENKRGEVVSDNVCAAIERAHANLFYRELEDALSEETIPMEHNSTSKESDLGCSSSKRQP